MCGLSGSAGDLTLKEERIMKTLLMWGAVRGIDATGIASVNRYQQREIRLAKEVGTYWDLQDTNRFMKVFQGTSSCFIGHNRSKTVGENTRRNAHPFLIEESLVGAHNGTLDFQNKNRLDHGHEFKTDSEAIMNNIFVHGIEDTIGRIEADEAYALTWYDKRDDTINFIRNKERPLLYAKFKEDRSLIWCSEFGMLVAAMGREDIKLSEVKVKEATADTWYSWKIPTTDREALGEPTRKKLANYTRVYSFDSKKNQSQTKRIFGTGTKPGGTSEADWDSDYTYGLEVGDVDGHGNTWQGKLFGWVPDKNVQTVTPKATSEIIVNKAIEAVKAGDLGSDNRQKIMSDLDVIRKRAWGHAETAHLVPDTSKEENKDLYKFYTGTNLQVWRNSKDGEWTFLRYNAARASWELFEKCSQHPYDMPFTPINIDSDHAFCHEGKLKRGTKRIYYKGFNGLKLDENAFAQAMEEECVSCQRKPAWGNKVFFVSPHNEFLCEFCKLTPGLYETLLSASKQKVA